MEAFFPVLVLGVVGLILSGALFMVIKLFGPHNPNASKLSVYECGVKPEGGARQPFQNRFYLIAVLFLLFDVEAAFFFPWALVYRDSLKTGGSLLLAFVVYMFFMVLGLIYIFQKDALELN